VARILVIDNNVKQADGLKRQLLERNNEAESFYTSKGAINKIIEYQPDVIILDIALPEMDGFELCKAIRDNSVISHIKILALTGVETSSNAEVMALSCVDDYLKKPTDIRVINARIGNLLRSKSSNLDNSNNPHQELDDNVNSERQSTASVTELDIIKIGILRVPKSQAYPIILIATILFFSVGIVTLIGDQTRLIGAVSLVLGLAVLGLGYQIYRDKFTENPNDANNKYSIVFIVLSADRQPINGAFVTVIGPVPFTNQKTNRDGRVKYSFRGKDVNTFRNRELTVNVENKGVITTISTQLHPEYEHFIEIMLK